MPGKLMNNNNDLNTKQGNIHLLRHGKTTAGSAYIGSTDVELTALGWEQMQSSVEQYLMANSPWDCILTSPLQRCSKFAQALADQLSIPLVVKDPLREYHFGDWENKTALQVMDQYPNMLELFWSDPLHNPPHNGETLSQFSERIDAVLAEVKLSASYKKPLLICHGGVMRYLLSQEQKLPISSMLDFPVDHGQLMSISH